MFDGDGLVVIAGSSFCTSHDFGATWTCRAAVDASGMDGGVACEANGVCLTGGGEISDPVSGWVHVSTNGTEGPWSARSSFPFPIRTVIALPTLLIAAGGNFYSGVGGIYVSADAGQTWTNSINNGEEFHACRALPLAHFTRVFCVSAGQTGGAIYSLDV